VLCGKVDTMLKHAVACLNIENSTQKIQQRDTVLAGMDAAKTQSSTTFMQGPVSRL
jgi:hypothetical protein